MFFFLVYLRSNFIMSELTHPKTTITNSRCSSTGWLAITHPAKCPILISSRSPVAFVAYCSRSHAGFSKCSGYGKLNQIARTKLNRVTETGEIRTCVPAKVVGVCVFKFSKYLPKTTNSIYVS